MKVPVEFDVGDCIVVEVRSPNHLLPALFPDRSSSVVYQGEYVASEAYDPKNSFRMTGSGMMPVRVIMWDNVLTVNGEPTEHNEVAKPSQVFRTIITGSKGNQYQVEIDEHGNAKCVCKGYGFRGYCAHCDEAREQLANQKK